jgi:hypothetical protein
VDFVAIACLKPEFFNAVAFGGRNPFLGCGCGLKQKEVFDELKQG